jgi:SAM-dependent methyltransferase
VIDDPPSPAAAPRLRPAGTTTAYDTVAYPSLPFPETLPDRLAMVARLHGLSAPDIATARVLELGGGDGSNIIAMATAHPQGRFANIDISATAIARGLAMARGVGLANVAMAVSDIVALADSLEGEFDYVIAHGVYSWVPAPVRAALLRLIGRVLARDGVAFVSYNAFPGCHMRVMLREMLLFEFGGIADPAERATVARAWLADLGEARAEDRLITAALRNVARPMARKPLPVLHHDELGEIYEPQHVSSFAAAAATEGLAFLNDASPLQFESGFPGADTPESEVISEAQRFDHRAIAFFHETLLVRADRSPRRAPDFDAIADLWVAGRSERLGIDRFRCDDSEFTLGDGPLADALEQLSGIWPERRRVGDIAADPDRREALFALATTAEAVSLHAGARPGVTSAGSHPRASPLARWQIAQGSPLVHTLDHRVITLREAGPRAFLSLLDGSRDRAALAADWAATPYAGEVSVAAGLAQFAAAALLLE